MYKCEKNETCNFGEVSFMKKKINKIKRRCIINKRFARYVADLFGGNNVYC